eukprot:1161135-Pelagomonas_calceolata.AAC.7
MSGIALLLRLVELPTCSVRHQRMMACVMPHSSGQILGFKLPLGHEMHHNFSHYPGLEEPLQSVSFFAPVSCLLPQPGSSRHIN